MANEDTDNSEILGRGWSFPAVFYERGAQVSWTSGEEKVSQALLILFSTRPGERFGSPEYGCDLGRFLFADLDTGTLGEIEQVVGDAILNFEPRVQVNEISAALHPENPEVINIELEYTVISTNSRYNLVLPFAINEASVSIESAGEI